MPRTKYVFPIGIQVIDGEVVAGETLLQEPEPTGVPKLDAWAAVRLEWKRNGLTARLVELERLAKEAKDTR